MIRPGRMRSTVTIETPAVTRGDFGETVWETFETVRGEFVNETGRETSGPERVGAIEDLKFVTRYLPGVKANMRLTLNGTGRKFIILFVQTDRIDNARQSYLWVREITTA